MATTFFSTSPVKYAFEASAQGLDYVWFNAIDARADTDSQLVEGIKTCNDLGLEVRGMPRWAHKLMENANLEPVKTNGGFTTASSIRRCFDH